MKMIKLNEMRVTWNWILMLLEANHLDYCVLKSEVNDDYEQKLIDLKESRNRLKQKTKQLLKQYRHKRSLLERKDQQLTAQRAGLIRLQTLHQSVESNHYIVIHHLGQQIIQTARLVSTLWPEKEDITHEFTSIVTLYFA